jgi:hypothetical protein
MAKHHYPQTIGSVSADVAASSDRRRAGLPLQLDYAPEAAVSRKLLHWDRAALSTACAVREV